MREKCFGAGPPLSSSREGRRHLGEPLPHQLADSRLPAQNIPCIGQRQLPASVARSHAVLALARGYSLTDRIAPGDTARLRVGVLTGH